MKRAKRTEREYLEAFLIAVIFLKFANAFVLETFYIPSPSMEKTLLIGDHLFVNRFIYGPALTGGGTGLVPSRDVNRGDIVIFRSPEEGIDVVKRCIAVAGDTVEIQSKRLYLNGEPVDDETYVQHTDSFVFDNRPYWPAQVRQRDNFGPFTVPDDHLFCLGDNRDNSHDSRAWGSLPTHLVKGRAFMIYWSYGGQTPDGTWNGAGERLKLIAKTLWGFIPKTRWERTFMLIR